MKMKRSNALAGSVGVTLVFLLVLAVGLLSTSSEAGSEGATGGEAAPAQTAGPAEGIKVHGHWIIEVRDPDGTMVERREFDNALTSQGKGTLMRLLERVSSVGTWGVLLSSTGGTHPCFQTPVSVPCLVRESVGGGLSSWAGVTHFTTLTVGEDAPVSTLVLQGTATAEVDGNIDKVESLSCVSTPPDLDPALCSGSTIFTSQTLASPVAITTGQQVLITVRISFS